MLNEPAVLPRLVADIGGTNARFAMFFDSVGTLSNERSMSCDRYLGPLDAIEAYLKETDQPRPYEIAMAVATPVTDDRIRLTNNRWEFSVEETRQALGVDRLLMLNDFTALALSLPHLTCTQQRQIGGGNSVANAAIALIGAGTASAFPVCCRQKMAGRRSKAKAAMSVSVRPTSAKRKSCASSGANFPTYQRSV